MVSVYILVSCTHTHSPPYPHISCLVFYFFCYASLLSYTFSNIEQYLYLWDNICMHMLKICVYHLCICMCTHKGTIPSKTFREAILYLTGYRQRGFYGKASVRRDMIHASDIRDRVKKVNTHTLKQSPKRQYIHAHVHTALFVVVVLVVCMHIHVHNI